MAVAVQCVLLSVFLLPSVQTGAGQCDARRISAAVLEVLLPVIKEIKDDINTLNELYSNMSETVVNLEKCVEEHKNQTSSELADLRALLQSHIDGHPTTDVVGNTVLLRVLPYLNNMEDDVFDKIDESVNSLAADFHNDLSSLKDSVTDIKVKVCDLNETVEEHRSQTSSTLADLCEKVDDSSCGDFQDGLSSLNESVTALNELQINHDNNICSKLDSLDSKQDQLSMKVMSVASELEENILSNVTEELKQTSDSLLDSFRYYICGGEDHWRRVVYLDMTDPTTTCPFPWMETDYSIRTCHRATNTSYSCDSVLYPVTGGGYSQVCGKMRAYQWGLGGAFRGHRGGLTTIDEAYFSGVAVMHGSPRQHVWTFAAGATEGASVNYVDVCPCDTTYTDYIGAGLIPLFLNDNYFCESGYLWPGTYIPSDALRFHSDDPLWDGQDCPSSSTCCSLNNPPYFKRTLDATTNDDIELRMCHYHDVAVELIELYVK